MLKSSNDFATLQRMVTVMTIVDDIFEVKPFFKKIHTDTVKIER